MVTKLERSGVEHERDSWPTGIHPFQVVMMETKQRADRKKPGRWVCEIRTPAGRRLLRPVGAAADGSWRWCTKAPRNITNSYALQHSVDELYSLALQSRMYNPPIAQFFTSMKPSRLLAPSSASKRGM